MTTYQLPPPGDAAYCLLTLDHLRQANRHFQPTSRNRRGNPSHARPDGSDWTLADWYAAFVGEIGEMICEPPGRDYQSRVGAELADATIFLDLLAAAAGLSLTKATRGEIGAAYDVVHKVYFADLPWRLKPAHPWHTIDADIGAALRMGDVIKKIRRGDFPTHERPEELLSPYLGRAMLGLTRIAERAVVDLAQAVAQKFNQVSARVNSPITLRFDDRGDWFVHDARTGQEAVGPFTPAEAVAPGAVSGAGVAADDPDDDALLADPDAVFVGADGATVPDDGAMAPEDDAAEGGP